MAPPRYSKETIKYWNERILAQISNQRGTRRRIAEKNKKTPSSTSSSPSRTHLLIIVFIA